MTGTPDARIHFRLLNPHNSVPRKRVCASTERQQMSRNGWQPGPITDQSREILAPVGRSSNGRANRVRERVRRWPRARGGRSVSYARRQQYRRLSHAGKAALGSVGAALLGLVIASAGAALLAGLLLLTAFGLALYARHWLSLGRSRVGARSEDEVQRALAPLRADGWQLRRPGGGGETSTPWRLLPLALRSRSRRRPGHTTVAISFGCASRWPGCHDAGEGGLATGRSASCAWSARGASSGSSTASLWSRSTGWRVSFASLQRWVRTPGSQLLRDAGGLRTRLPGAVPVGQTAVGIEHVAPRALRHPFTELLILGGELADAHDQNLAAADRCPEPSDEICPGRAVTEEVGHSERGRATGVTDSSGNPPPRGGTA
jgi:hypothetical protein